MLALMHSHSSQTRNPNGRYTNGCFSGMDALIRLILKDELFGDDDVIMIIRTLVWAPIPCRKQLIQKFEMEIVKCSSTIVKRSVAFMNESTTLLNLYIPCFSSPVHQKTEPDSFNSRNSHQQANPLIELILHYL
jgi:hypothetical protein